MVITRATEYAIRALLFLAKQPQGEIVYKKDICQCQDITPAFLTKILQPLIKAGIVGSQRGVGGGFFLAKSPAEITMLDILVAEEGPLDLNICISDADSCERSSLCPVHDAWHEIRASLAVTLSRYTLEYLVEKEKTKLTSLLSKS